MVNLDGTTTQTPSSLQESWSQKHWLLQYDLMFGKGYDPQPDGHGKPEQHSDGRINKKYAIFL